MNCIGCPLIKYCGTMVSSVELHKSRSVYEGLSEDELKELAIELENNI